MRLEIGTEPRPDAWVITPWHAAEMRGSDCEHVHPCDCFLLAVFNRIVAAAAGFRSIGDRLHTPQMVEYCCDWEAILRSSADRCNLGAYRFARARHGHGSIGVRLFRRIRILAARSAIEDGLYPVEFYFGEKPPEPIVLPPSEIT